MKELYRTRRNETKTGKVKTKNQRTGKTSYTETGFKEVLLGKTDEYVNHVISCCRQLLYLSKELRRTWCIKYVINKSVKEIAIKRPKISSFSYLV